MYFSVRKIKGIDYLYKKWAYRDEETGKPTNSSKCVGAVSKVEIAIKRWRDRHG